MDARLRGHDDVGRSSDNLMLSLSKYEVVALSFDKLRMRAQSVGDGWIKSAHDGVFQVATNSRTKSILDGSGSISPA